MFRSTSANLREYRIGSQRAIALSGGVGELSFFVGGNGRGKSTLAKLISGLYVPDTGEIRLDGNVIDDRNRELYRQLFSREIFYQQLLPELKQSGKALLVISHDDRYFHLADRLLKLDYWKIVVS